MCSDRRHRVSPRAVLLAFLLPLGALGALAALTGCGKQGDPEPKPRAIPQPGGDLTVRQRGTELLFEVSYPHSTVAGLPIEGLASATLYEAVVPALLGQKAPPLRETELAGVAKPVVELTGAALDAAVVGDKIRFKVVLPETALFEPLPPPPPPAPVTSSSATTTGASPAGAPAPSQPTPPTTPPATTAPAAPPAAPPATTATPPTAAPPATPGATPPATTPTTPTATAPAATPPATPPVVQDPNTQARVYAVRTKESRGLDSPWSNVVGLVPLKTPPAPGSLRVEAAKNGVALGWTASEGAVGYVVLRRDATAADWGPPVATLPKKDTSFVDLSAVYGSRYVYSVVALARLDPPSESAAQSAREIDYRDRFAPEAPTELRALFVSGEVRLVWEGSPDSDLRGYRVERSVRGGAFEPALPELVTGTDATDPNPARGARARYRLIAIDQVGNTSTSDTVEIDVP